MGINGNRVDPTLTSQLNQYEKKEKDDTPVREDRRSINQPSADADEEQSSQMKADEPEEREDLFKQWRSGGWN